MLTVKLLSFRFLWSLNIQEVPLFPAHFTPATLPSASKAREKSASCVMNALGNLAKFAGGNAGVHRSAATFAMVFPFPDSIARFGTLARHLEITSAMWRSPQYSVRSAGVSRCASRMQVKMNKKDVSNASAADLLKMMESLDSRLDKVVTRTTAVRQQSSDNLQRISIQARSLRAPRTNSTPRTPRGTATPGIQAARPKRRRSVSDPDLPRQVAAKHATTQTAEPSKLKN